MIAKLETEILSLSGSDYLVLYVVFLLLFFYLVYFAFNAFRRFRFVDGTATSRIRSAAQGLVELKGLAEWLPEDSFVSPFSGNRCVWYHCTIDEKRRGGKRTSWVNISDECSSHLFRLVDETGDCAIDPDDAHVIPESDRTWYGSSTDARLRPPASNSWLRSVGFGSYRFRERLIRPATSLYALGWFHTVHSNPSDEFISKQIEDLVRQWKLQPERYLRQFDLDKNRRLEGDEWKVVRADARKQILAKLNREHRAHHVMSRPKQKNQPYILSAVTEETLVDSKKRQGYFAAVGAFLLFSGLVVMYSIRQPLGF
ncbi:MAG: GIDE domain-containing protein [Pseudomonadota bacterium]